MFFGGCLSEPGRSDYTLSPNLQVTFDPYADSGRLTGLNVVEEGTYPIKLKNGDIFVLEELSFDIDTITYRLASESLLSAFDPQNPPPQYSLCHNGHCHHDDGHLVDYEDIVLEQAESATVQSIVLDIDSPYALAISELDDVSCPANSCEFIDSYPSITDMTLRDVRVLGTHIHDDQQTSRVFEIGIIALQGFVEDISELEYGEYALQHQVDIQVQLFDALIADNLGETSIGIGTAVEEFFVHTTNIQSFDMVTEDI